MNDIYQNIRQIRMIRNFDQSYVATRLGVSTEWYSKMENGKTKITLEQLDKIAQALEVNPADFYTFKPSQVFDQCNQQGAFIGNNQHFSMDKEMMTQLMGVLQKISDKI